MHIKLKGRARAIAGVTALAVVASVLPMANAAQALPPGTAAAGLADMVPGTGNSGTNFNISLPAGASCPGDGPAGYRWGTYITPLSNDPAAMLFDGLGSPSGQPAFSSSLRNPGGTFVRAQTPGIGDGLIALPAAGFSFQVMPVPAGAYNIGIVCTLNTGAQIENTRFWNNQITVTTSAGAGPQNFTYSEGVVPSTPTLTTVTPGNATCQAAFTGGTGATGFTVTANPGGITQTGASSPITVGGLSNGTEYTLTVTANNATGTSPASNSLTCTPAEAARPPVQNLVATPGTGEVTVSFAAPTGTAPTGYTLAISPAPDAPQVTPVSIPAGPGPFSSVVTGLTPGTTYTFTVTPLHDAPAAGTPASVTAAPYAAQVLNQEISVERPVGALVLTQRCGVHNGLDAFAAVDAFPGFPRSLAAATPTADQLGTAPIDDDNAPALDGEFPEYPFPSNPTYPTTCGVSLGTATLVSSGPLAGQYYTADGLLNEITVVDTRDTDVGWSVTGTMEAFTTTGDSFEGNYLGWDPQVADDSDGAYDQVVTAGPVVLPGTGVATADPGLGEGRTLASSLAGEGLGIAELDARLMLLIPSEANAGVYTGTLSFTAIDHNP